MGLLQLFGSDNGGSVSSSGWAISKTGNEECGMGNGKRGIVKNGESFKAEILKMGIFQSENHLSEES